MTAEELRRSEAEKSAGPSTQRDGDGKKAYTWNNSSGTIKKVTLVEMRRRTVVMIISDPNLSPLSNTKTLGMRRRLQTGPTLRLCGKDHISQNCPDLQQKKCTNELDRNVSYRDQAGCNERR